MELHDRRAIVSSLAVANMLSGEELWNYLTDDSIFSSPIVVDEIVYIGSEDYTIYALAASTGEVYWNYTTGGIIDSSPTVAEGIVYFGSQDHTFYALSAQAGEKLWSYITAGGILSCVELRAR